ncbi:flagellar protein export ATPase FliI [Pseudalkalibacillus salsuginis]|uniref:flagellar protein export ATPase FliI n=1 Tax=Pseudalkalibacillus salsuginis TaxID=2910972 RepID=UPI001F2659FE|nr:flagellar protein export ATPase FliI [Pseudalkalibacillus salsuginis]MCF6410567.1 flagellar protein export ATPase FliI [Pseudalkalibacillus salsuginis]
MDIKSMLAAVNKIDPYKRFGKVNRVIGIMIESKGPRASIGDVCYIHTGEAIKRTIPAEVVGFREEHVLLMPFTSIQEISPGSLVEGTGKPLQIKAGEALIGKVLDGLGRPLGGEDLPNGLKPCLTDTTPPNPMERPRINENISCGVRAIDSFLTIGKGQRIGIFAGSGVGKSTLLGMVARRSSADINIIALIGERGREVREFVELELGEEGLRKTIVVAATSDQPALLRIKGALTATTLAEYFRNQGKNVMLMMDSVTRVAMAQREVGLAVGEPPATKGYTPSVFALLPKLLERSGTYVDGSITAFYTVLVDGDDMNEPIADAVRGILDGHIVLDRELANKGHFPSINVLKSISRIMNNIADPIHMKAASKARDLLASYAESEDLISIGAYKKGNSKKVDEAIHYYPKIMAFLRQETNEDVNASQSVEELLRLFQEER